MKEVIFIGGIILFYLYIKYLLLYCIYFPYSLGSSGEPWPPLTVMDGPSCAQFGWFHSTGCLLVLTFYFLCRIRPSGPKYLWVKSVWKFFWVWVLPGAPIGRFLVRRRPNPAGAVLWSNVLAPCTPGFTGVSPTPRWWQSYYWRIRKSYSRVAAI